MNSKKDIQLARPEKYSLRLRQILFVCFAFIMMIAISYTATNIILRSHLTYEAQELLRVAELTIASNLRETLATLATSSFTIRDMIERGESQESILHYMVEVTDWLMNSSGLVYGFNGLYGFIRREYLDGLKWEPPPDYVPQERPWFIAAKEKSGNLAETIPYIDAHTGEIVVSYSQELFSATGISLGVLSIDILLNQLGEYAENLRLSGVGYGLLLNQNFEIMAHPDVSLRGKRLDSVSSDYAKIQAMLADSRPVTAISFTNSENIKHIAFFKQLNNGWYIGTIIPHFSFYRDLYIAAVILVTVGLVLSASLCFILLRFAAAKMRADKNNESKSSFLASMSHEIRTPMNAIIGMAELLLRKDIPDDARNDAQDIKQAGNNLLSIINDILDFSKIEAGKLEIKAASYSPASLIHDTATIIQMRLEEKPIRFSINVAPDIPNSLIGDEVRLRQIMLNLLSNAVKYTEEGHIGLTVSTRKQDDAHIWLKIAVSDTGKGINPEDRSKLFGDFVRLDMQKNQSIEGTGLGLAITKRLCEAMGGSITVESEYGKGSCFTAEIIQSFAGEAVIGEETAENLQNFHYAGGNLRRFAARCEFAALTENKKFDYQNFDGVKVLVADDNMANLRVARGLLAPYKFGVDTVESGKEAVERVQRKNYDLIFMDHMMPEMDGVEAVAAIRTLGKNVPIIAMTANAISGMREYYLENGFDDYLTKPINPHLLDEILKRRLPESLFPTLPSVPNLFLPLVEEQRLDMLNHYRETFVSGLSSIGLTPDAEYYKKFTGFIKSLNIEDTGLREQAVVLVEAGLQEDAHKIRELLPGFCKDMQNISELRKQPKRSDGGDDQKILSKLLPRLENAIMNNERETAEAVMKELTAADLTDKGRELYFRLNDLMFEGDTEKIMELLKGGNHD